MGSNAFCRSACLVYAGQNAAADYVTYLKAAMTAALLAEPAAFVRITVSAIERHAKFAPKAGLHPFVRLNVLSDIPWEALYPWLFARFDGSPVQFYDYTKVHGRWEQPGNYDLSFSYSGTNAPLAVAELDHGRRVVVVFLAFRQRKGEWQSMIAPREMKRYEIPLPETFAFPGHQAHAVVDGDRTDLRSLDSAPSIVGLRWKPPSKVKAGIEVDPRSPAFKFVTPIYMVEGTARYQPNPRDRVEGEWLVAPVTPRFQGLPRRVWRDVE